jgi:hypothetical protein
LNGERSIMSAATGSVRTMTITWARIKRFSAAGLAVGLVAPAVIATAPPASAGCQQVLPTEQVCDGPIQPDGTWQRCEVKLFDLSDQLCMNMSSGTALPYGPPGHIDP